MGFAFAAHSTRHGEPEKAFGGYGKIAAFFEVEPEKANRQNRLAILF